MLNTRALGLTLVCALAAWPRPVVAQEVIVRAGDVLDDGGDFFVIPFEVPDGIAEIEVAHDDGSDVNILDWGLWSPSGFRGWGGGNVENAIVGTLAASRSYRHGPIEAGTWEVVVGKAKIVDAPATYEVTITLRETATLPPDDTRAPFSPVTLSSSARFYAGDFHVHSRESGDADATFDEIATLSRARGIDFVVITDHNTDSHVDLLKGAQDAHDDVLFIPGCEFTTYRGHVGAAGALSYVDHRVGFEGHTLDDAFSAYGDAGVVLTINHPVLDLGDLCIGCAWDHEDEVLSRAHAVEIMTGGNTIFLDDALAFWDSKFDRGFPLAAVGGSDDHRAGRATGFAAAEIGTPTTMVYASELSMEGILAGVRAGLTVVLLEGADGPMVEFAMDPPRKSSVVLVPREASATTLAARVTRGAGSALRLVKNGFPVDGATVDIATDDEDVAFDIDVVIGDRYRVELVRDERSVVITSHIVLEEDVTVGPEDCNCDAVDGEGSRVALAFAFAFACARVRRRGRA